MRPVGWKEALHQCVAAEASRTFAYGEHDCALFAARCVAAVTGIDHAAAFGAYDSAKAQQLLAEHNGVEGIATMILGEPAPPNHCRAGDVVVADLPLGPTLGICLGSNCAFAAARGLLYMPRSVIRCGWRI